MNETVPLSDEALAAQAFQGDRQAFTALYERYFSQVYDLALRMTRSPDRAADIAQDTFFKLLENKGAATEFTSFRAWLFTVVRHRTIDELRKAKRTDAFPDESSDEDEAQFYEPVSPGPGPESQTITRDIAAMVWEAASSLRPEEYALLDMHLRKGLEVDELVQVLGTSKGNVYTQLSRLQDALEGAITALIVSRRGNKDCPALANLLTATAPEMTPRLRRQILRHIESCDTCQRTRKRYVTASQLLAGLAPIVPPTELQQAVLGKLLAQFPAAPSTGSAEGMGQSAGARSFDSTGLGKTAAGKGGAGAGRAASSGSGVMETAIAVPVALGILIAGAVVLAALVLYVPSLFRPTPIPILSLPYPDTITPVALPSSTVADVSTETPILTPAPGTPSPLPTLAATTPASEPAIIPTRTATPTPTSPPPSPQVQFWADNTNLGAGQCTGLHWRTQSVQAVYMNGEPVTGNEDRQVCPSVSTTYSLRVDHAGGTLTRQVGVQVATRTPTRTRTPTPRDTVGPSILEVRESTDTMWYGAVGCTGSYDVTIDARVTDPSGVAEVTLYYRRRGTSTWLTRTMTSTGGGWYTGGKIYSRDVAGTGTSNQTLEYYVRARDARGNYTQGSLGTVTMRYCYSVS